LFLPEKKKKARTPKRFLHVSGFAFLEVRFTDGVVGVAPLLTLTCRWMEIRLAKSNRTLCDCHCSSYVFPTASQTVAHADRGCSPRIYHLGVIRRESTALETERANLRGVTHRQCPPREGPELLQGLVVCGRCGGRMTVFYHLRRGLLLPYYRCLGRKDSDVILHGECHSIAESRSMKLSETFCWKRSIP